MELWSIARGQTPFVVLLLLAAVYLLNSERRLLQSKYDELFKQCVELAHDTRDTLKDIRDLFGAIAASRGRRWPDE
jgi:predicted metal-dependent hydrolase